MSWNTLEYTGWGRVLTAEAEIARPERAAMVGRLMAGTPAPARGMCRSYGDACLNDGGRMIDTGRLDRILGFDEATGIVTVEAGIRVGDLAAVFAPRGWLPPVMPGTGFATIGGCIANDVHGKNHHLTGSFGENVVSITLATPKGVKVIGPKKQGPLFRATVGGLGQTGVIVSAEIQLLKCKSDVFVVTERRIEGWDEFIVMLDASDASYTVGWIDATATGAQMGRGILEEAETGGGLVGRPKRAKAVPFNAPSGALSPAVVRAFNAAYLRRVPAAGRTVVKPIQDFFFPLDKLLNWNRLYGKTGFHQFQCVVPVESVGRLRSMMEKIATSGIASPLSVLKRLGPGRGGMMSFPMDGYTLAVDFPNRPGAAELIAELIADTADAGGRIYFAKDSLASPAQIAGMYPERDKWIEQLDKVDPDGAMTTDLIRRLKLRN